MKRFVAVLVLAVFAAVALAACGGGNDQQVADLSQQVSDLKTQVADLQAALGEPSTGELSALEQLDRQEGRIENLEGAVGEDKSPFPTSLNERMEAVEQDVSSFQYNVRTPSAFLDEDGHPKNRPFYADNTFSALIKQAKEALAAGDPQMAEMLTRVGLAVLGVVSCMDTDVQVSSYSLPPELTSLLDEQSWYSFEESGSNLIIHWRVPGGGGC